MTSGCILFRIFGTPLRQRTPKFNFYHWLTDLHINQEPNPIPDDLGSWPMNPDCVYTKEKAANSKFLRLEIFYKQSQEKIWILQITLELWIIIIYLQKVMISHQKHKYQNGSKVKNTYLYL